MNDLKFAFRQLLKNPGFTVHPPQCRRADRVQIPQGCSRKAGHLRQYSYGGRAVAVLTLALGIGTNTAINICSDKTPSSLQRQTLLPVAPVAAVGFKASFLAQDRVAGVAQALPEFVHQLGAFFRRQCQNLLLDLFDGCAHALSSCPKVGIELEPVKALSRLSVSTIIN